MAYTGFFAGEDLYEIAAPVKKARRSTVVDEAEDGKSDEDGEDGGDEAEETEGTGETKADKGTWVIPARLADSYPADVFVREPAEHGGPGKRRRYQKGEFVFRLSGRDRQRSASYYTPEVLTRCVVKHSLAELIDDETPAAAILDLTICEPACGSGAFVNEAVNQLAAEYLRRAQAEPGEMLDPDRYHVELQRVKAHLAVNNVYGVDLNPTAVELAEVSVWLNVMHPGLAAPWFGLRLRRGNSLIGARRATYPLGLLAKGAWKDVAPMDRPLAEHAFDVLTPARCTISYCRRTGGERWRTRRKPGSCGPERWSR